MLRIDRFPLRQVLVIVVVLVACGPAISFIVSDHSLSTGEPLPSVAFQRSMLVDIVGTTCNRLVSILDLKESHIIPWHSRKFETCI